MTFKHINSTTKILTPVKNLIFISLIILTNENPVKIIFIT